MSSNIAPGRHLDATTGREVVYCHGCRNEWYRDQQEGLECPRCHSEITEIVTPGENDPREPEIAIGPAFIFRRGPERDADSDPEEDDIEEHMHFAPHGHGFFAHRTNANPDAPRDGTPGAANHPPHANAAEADIFRNFTDLLMNIGGGQPNQPNHPNQPNQQNQSDQRGQANQQNQAGPGANSGPGRFFPGSPDNGVHVAGPHRVERRTWRAGPFGAASVTIVSTGAPVPGANGGLGGFGGFDAVLANVLGGGPPVPPGADGQAGPQGARPPNLGFNIHELFRLLMNPAGAVQGDAVYTQEAFDRIISQLMEQNAQSNAAPPASSEAIAKLPTRKLEEQDLDAEGKAECTICIDEMHKGDEVTVLPCKHWFHGECVTMWLKEHNTCPNEARLNAIRNLGGVNLSDQSSNGTSSSQQQQGEGLQQRRSYSPPRDYPVSFRSRSPNRDNRANEQAPFMSGWNQPQHTDRRDQESQGDRQGGSSSNEGGGPLSWLRGAFSRQPGSGSGSGDRRSQ
ncbi:hypothetical protein DL546_007434 [Coniochaeta pulveracea]|uniref:RING-type E3 ubiquitin transferase n=1 Tax=Coniochaeta pulveracea TaxID=177199 RepID=A0A420YH56_9PEZI|nr:hypothetical protein DL546_007434 [Coniochaeta pulveracea]